ncbi:hypothetical protein HYC85_015873 [Camellia sinensis]|uniref:non-specific serine/threonine protein kinase n=1 Tax=Camellia sinensis TaxID=4442 RepID=A0A7J7GZC4_CAMSI|nr:hypothetical protein HYC85_015873 [Camellia sinensis]
MFFMFLVVKTNWKRECRLDSKWEFTQFQLLNFSKSDILSSLTESHMIGFGGSGKVYRVVLNRWGKVVAVKKTRNIKKLDKKVEMEFRVEVQILGAIRHSNIVKLLCYISIHHDVLDWPKRLQIVVGTARGLCYMHHECSPAIIHRDMKSSNILLDSSFNAKVADFGVAKMLLEGKPTTMEMKILALPNGHGATFKMETPLVDALDEEVKEPCYLDETTCVFKLGIICMSTFPLTRPNMKVVLQILLSCCSHRPELGEKIDGSENAGVPLLKNSRRERLLDNKDNTLVSKV